MPQEKQLHDLGLDALVSVHFHNCMKLENILHFSNSLNEAKTIAEVRIAAKDIKQTCDELVKRFKAPTHEARE